MEAARLATADDLPRLAELTQEALAELAPARGGEVFVAREARAEPIEASLAVQLADPDFGLWAGTIDGVVVGLASCRIEKLRDGTRLGLIEELFVEPHARGVGVGEAMVQAVLGWLREQECAGVDALALPGNRATKNFFEASGFSARLIVMHHRLRG